MTDLQKQIQAAIASDNYKQLQAAHKAAKSEGYSMNGIKGNAPKSDLILALSLLLDLESTMERALEVSEREANKLTVDAPKLSELKSNREQVLDGLATNLKEFKQYFRVESKIAIEVILNWYNNGKLSSNKALNTFVANRLKCFVASYQYDEQYGWYGVSSIDVEAVANTIIRELTDEEKTQLVTEVVAIRDNHINEVKASLQADVDAYEEKHNCKLEMRGNSVVQVSNPEPEDAEDTDEDTLSVPYQAPKCEPSLVDKVIRLRVAITCYYNNEIGVDDFRSSVNSVLGREFTFTELTKIRELSKPAFNASVPYKYDGVIQSECLRDYLTTLLTSENESEPEPHTFVYVTGAEKYFHLAHTTWQNYYRYNGHTIGEDELRNLGYIRVIPDTQNTEETTMPETTADTVYSESEYAFVDHVSNTSKTWQTNVQYNRIPRRVRRRGARFLSELSHT